MSSRENDLELDEATHCYTWQGRGVASVTQIITDAGRISSFSMVRAAAERGRVVHKAAALLVAGRLDWTSVDARLVGYVKSYARLIEATGWVARSVETRRYCPVYDYAGTFDVSFEDQILADLKTGGPAAWHRAQLGAYWNLNGRDDRCIGVYLQADGSIARLKETDGLDGFIEFLECLEQAGR